VCDLTPPRKVVPGLSERVDWAIRRAMSPSPEQRPECCREFVEDLIGRSTRPPTPAEKAAVESDIWYLVYHDEFGRPHSVKGGIESIRRALREGLLGDAATMTACRHKQGPFLELKQYPEFRDLLISPVALAPVTVAKATPAPAAAMPPQLPADWKPRVDGDGDPPPRDPLAWRGRRAPQPLGGRRYSRAYEILLWVVVMLAALVTALLVFHFFPPR
jgi:hypothetical protein